MIASTPLQSPNGVYGQPDMQAVSSRIEHCPTCLLCNSCRHLHLHRHRMPLWHSDRFFIFFCRVPLIVSRPQSYCNSSLCLPKAPTSHGYPSPKPTTQNKELHHSMESAASHTFPTQTEPRRAGCSLQIGAQPYRKCWQPCTNLMLIQPQVSELLGGQPIACTPRERPLHHENQQCCCHTGDATQCTAHATCASLQARPHHHTGLRHSCSARAEARHLIPVLPILSNTKATWVCIHILQQLTAVWLWRLVRKLDAVVNLGQGG